MQSEKSSKTRPTKKQRELLEFIETFILEHGYSPSYREIMSGLNYNSVATVALHINSLIKRGHLIKRDRSARSLEVVQAAQEPKLKSNLIKPDDEKWLVEKVEQFFSALEGNSVKDPNKIDELYVLIGALRILGMEGAVQSFLPRLSAIKDTVQ